MDHRAYIELAFNKFFGVIAMTLIIVGTTSNTFCLIILLRKRLRVIPTFVFFAFMVFFDTLSLYGWNLNNFFKACFNTVLEDLLGKPLCTTVMIWQCVSSQSSAWILVAMCIERYLSVRIRVWRRLHFNSNRAIIASLAIFTLIFALNIHLVFTIEFNVAENETVGAKCFSQPMRAAWREIHIYIYSIAPFVVLTVANSLLLYETLRKRAFTRTDLNQSKRKSMSLSVVFLTCLFIVCTAPNALSGKFLNNFLDGEWSINLLFFVNSIGYSYHSFNFLVFIQHNKQFSQEVKEIYKGIWKQRKSSSRAVPPLRVKKNNAIQLFAISFHDK